MFSKFLRRVMRPLVLLAVLSLVLTACAPAATPAVPTAQPTEETSAYPVTIEHKYGSTTIDKFPERIVLVGLTEQDAMLALGVVPVATSEWYGKRPGAIFDWAKDKLGSAPVPVVLNSVEINFEQIASLKPDLIVGLYAGITQDTYNTLSKIAPTVAQPKEYVDYGIPWQELTRKIGLIVGKNAEAEALIAKVDADFAAAKAAHPEFAGKTGVVASTWGFDKGNYYAYHSQDPRNRFMTALGFTVPAEIDTMAGKEYGATISLERLDIVDTDALVWITLGDKEVQEQKKNELYSKTKATQEGRDIFLVEADPVYDALNFMTVLSIPFALEKMLPRLSAAVDGDPTTIVDGEPGAAVAEPSAATFPVTIEHKFGSTTIPAEPKRVISLGYSEQDVILALGVTPIAIRDWFGDQPYGVWPWSQEALGDAKPELLKMGFGELNFEQLAALKPDLIIATHSGITEDEYKKLAQIAPTLALPGKYDDFGVPWQEQTLLIGQALGRSEKAKALVAETEAKIEAAAAAHPEFAKSSIAWLTPTEGPTEYWVVGPNTPPLRFLQKLGFQYPADVATLVGTASSGKISTERLDMVDTGVMILGGNSQREAILADPLFQQLKAAKEGRILFFGLKDPVYGALSFSTVTSLSYLVDELIPQLVAAADGDPATTVP